MKVALITGANRGIGWQTAKELCQRGCRVYIGTRQAKTNGEAVADLDGDARWLSIDVADSQSIHAAADWLAGAESQLDVLINNAGIYQDQDTNITTVTRSLLEKTFATNTFGPIEVSQAFLALLRKSSEARIINVSSGYGQLDGISPDVPSYCLSKLTLNGVTLLLSAKLKQDGIAVNSVCPGWVRTDMGGSEATRSVEEGAAGIVWLASEAAHDWTGKFFRDGKEINW